jgi:hypothetical protein
VGVGATLGDARSRGVDEIADGLRPKKENEPPAMDGSVAGSSASSLYAVRRQA